MAPKILLDNWMKLPSLQGIQQRRGGMHSTGWDQVGKLRFLHFFAPLHFLLFCIFAFLQLTAKDQGRAVHLFRSVSLKNSFLHLFLYQSCSWLPNHAQLSFNFESAILFVGTIWQNMNKARTFCWMNKTFHIFLFQFISFVISDWMFDDNNNLFDYNYS